MAASGGYVVAARALTGDLTILAAVPAPAGGLGLTQLPSGGIGILIVGVMLSLGSFTALSARRGPRRKALRDTRTDGPAHVGRYTLVSRIGEGGMAEITRRSRPASAPSAGRW